MAKFTNAKKPVIAAKKCSDVKKQVISKKTAGIQAKAKLPIIVRKRQVDRHAGIAVYLKREIAEWMQMLDSKECKSRDVYECPLCGRVCDRLFNMKRHAETHATGKLSPIDAIESGEKMRRPVFMEVMRALYDNDVMIDSTQGKYASRARALLASWLQYDSSASGTSSLIAAMGLADRNMVLVLTADGPQYWSRSDSRLEEAKKWGVDRYHTMDFANLFLQHLQTESGVYNKALRSMKQGWQRAGCEVTQLMHRNTQSLASISCDLMESEAICTIREGCQRKLLESGEYTSISVDATYKLSLKALGQYRNQGHNYTSVVGVRGSALALFPGRGESPLALREAAEHAVPVFARDAVQHVSSDVSSRGYYMELGKAFPCLKSMSLAPMHVCFAVDRHTKKHGIRPTCVGLVMRVIMGKFDMPDPSKPNETFYAGEKIQALTDKERRFVAMIKSGSMPESRAALVLKKMDPNAPMKTLVEFAELLAAVVVIYPERLDVRDDKTTLRSVLCNAASPERYQWYMNNVRHRTSLPPALEAKLGCGTTRNEQIHATVNRLYRTAICISRRVLDTQLAFWCVTSQMMFVRTLRRKLTRKMKVVDVNACMTASTCAFDALTWRKFAQMPAKLWKGSGQPAMAKRGKVKRGGPTDRQRSVYEAMLAKKTKVKRVHHLR